MRSRVSSRLTGTADPEDLLNRYHAELERAARDARDLHARVKKLAEKIAGLHSTADEMGDAPAADILRTLHIVLTLARTRMVEKDLDLLARQTCPLAGRG